MERAILTAGSVLAGTAALSAYANAKFHISKDLRAINRFEEAKRKWQEAVKRGEGSGWFLFQEAAQQYADEECIWSRNGVYSWRETYERVCQYGNYFRSLGVMPGDYVAVYMLNAPEFLFVWMGLLSIAAAPALINHNLAGDALVHCVKISETKILLVDADESCQTRVQGVKERLQSELGIEVITLDLELKTKLANSDPARPIENLHASCGDKLPLALIYTSGTTGLPKACALRAQGHYATAVLKPKAFGQIHGDRTYVCMPLYHGTGGLAAINDLQGGISVAIGRKFSRTNFWIDCIDSKSTVFVYVGETARYLLSAPPSENDRKHSIRLMWGNGLRPDVWAKFQERFGIPEIGEFYTSTEGMIMTNIHYRSGMGFGSVGHHGVILRHNFYNEYVPVKVDTETGDIWRSPKTGFAKRVPYDEGGEILVKMRSEDDWLGYYKAKSASEKKLLRDVFQKGDLYYRTGDALRRDGEGFWYFMDRLGDTYRWKSENVSTTEVGNIFGAFPGILEANVYGVTLPHYDGRAGCAALIIAERNPYDFDWVGLTNLLREKLPSYAIPIFIRLVHGGIGSMSTGNNKQNKVALRLEGVELELFGRKVPGGEKDTLLWLLPGANSYVPFKEPDWKSLQAREVKL